MSVLSAFIYAESCSVGATDKKYTPQGSCDYKTETRTCCEDGTWSDWDKECPSNKCGTGECYDSKTMRCEKADTTILCTQYKHIQSITGGTLTRKAVCKQWGWDYSEWEGKCECDEGFVWDNERMDCVQDSNYAARWKCNHGGRWGKTDCEVRGPDHIIEGTHCYKIGDYSEQWEMINDWECAIQSCVCEMY